jgi:hypothetical protein
MIDERELDAAVAAGIIDAGTQARLVQFVRDHRRGAAGPDEEQFRLLTGFNDIFVTIAIGLLLFAVASLGGAVSPVIGPALAAAASWGLAEYFTRQRRMALPSIVLLLSFVGSVFAAVLSVGVAGPLAAAVPGSLAVAVPAGTTRLANAAGPDALWLVLAASAAAGAAALHWFRFKVPITVAAGVAALGGLAIAILLAVIPPPLSQALLLPLVFVLGVVCFGLAMDFDSRDRARVTRWSDVAFWLHLLAAPAIVHPVFASSGILHATPSPGPALFVILVYALLTVVAVAIDRRALLVSALVYVIYAIQALVAGGASVGLSGALTALVIGGFLVMLSAAWRPIRARLLPLLPARLTAALPVASV